MCDEASLREFVLDRIVDGCTRLRLTGLSIRSALFGRRRVVRCTDWLFSIRALRDKVHVSLASDSDDLAIGCRARDDFGGGSRSLRTRLLNKRSALWTVIQR
ncbi:hypothetical protein BS17DRAFT_779351 [Gyrodon lividus]|nr:hypothetical protein BS17DRAFT_779351 [Gyrodon lividus]